MAAVDVTVEAITMAVVRAVPTVAGKAGGRIIDTALNTESGCGDYSSRPSIMVRLSIT